MSILGDLEPMNIDELAVDYDHFDDDEFDAIEAITDIILEEADGEPAEIDAPAAANPVPERVHGETFNEQLRRLISERGLNNSQLSKMTGITPTTIGVYVNGANLPSRQNIRKLCDALSVDSIGGIYPEAEPVDEPRPKPKKKQHPKPTPVKKPAPVDAQKPISAKPASNSSMQIYGELLTTTMAAFSGKELSDDMMQFIIRTAVLCAFKDW